MRTTASFLPAAKGLALTLAAFLCVSTGTAMGASPGPASPALPEPYGPATNGDIAFERDGDIWVTDPHGDDARSLITGPETDAWPSYSRDGSRLMFERQEPGAAPRLMIADADGTNVAAFTDIPGEFPWSDWSPDGRQFAAEWKVDDRLVLEVLTTDASEAPRTLDLGDVEIVDLAGFRPPDGGEIIFTGHPMAGSTQLGLYGIAPDGSGLRTVGALGTDGLFQQPSFSADGTRMAYWNWETNEAGVTGTYLHLRDLVTGDDRTLTLDPLQQGFGFAPRIAPDGESLLFEVMANDADAQLVLAPLDRHEPARAVGPSYPNDLLDVGFSPDGSIVVLDRGPGGTWLTEIATGETRELDDAVTGASWQRR